MFKIPFSKKNILYKKLHDPLFYIALVLIFFWLLDTWYKIFIQHAPTRMLWYSSMGMGVIAIGLILRSRHILSAMFSVLLFQEGIWNLSFLANLFFLPDYVQAASYAFSKNFPKIALFITLFHLLLLPSIIYGLYKIKNVSRLGWLGAYLFALIINYLPLFFPDKEDVNCVRGQIASCQIFFGAFYSINPLIGIFGGVTYQLFIIYIPANLLLVNIFNKRKSIANFLLHPFLWAKKTLTTPNFYIAALTFILVIFWIADTFEKVSVQHSISRIFWWSSSGLLLIIIGLYKRSSLILTGMFCALFIIESLWTISFLSFLFFQYKIPHLDFALYPFGPNYPLISFVITLFHLLLIPSSIFGLITFRKIHPYGWVLGIIFYIATASLAFSFPDIKENVNCSKFINVLCNNIFGFSSTRTFFENLITSSLYQLILFYIPINLALLFLFKKFHIPKKLARNRRVAK